MVDRVELVPLHEADEVRELQRHDAVRLEQDLQARDEVVEVGHLGQHVVADDEVGPASLRRELPGRRLAEELDQGRDALLLGRLGDVGAGSIPGRGCPCATKYWSR